MLKEKLLFPTLKSSLQSKGGKQVEPQGNSSFADGLAFSFVPHNFTLINTYGAAIGLPILLIFLPKATPFVVVEFDIFPNVWDPLETHVGIDINSLISNVNAIWCNNITYGKENEVWISYNSSLKNLSVVFPRYVNNQKIKSALSSLVDLGTTYQNGLQTLGQKTNKKALVVELTIGSSVLVGGLALFVFV
ncbi:hypothetical protein ACSBR2_021914 [Camellia fascicularis]